MNNAILLLSPVVNVVVTALFAGIVLRQYLQRHRIYQLYWSIGLVMAFVATLAYVLMIVVGPTSSAGIVFFRVYYILGGALVPAWLGLGSIALVASKQAVRIEYPGGGADRYGGCKYGRACSRGRDAGYRYFTAGAMADHYYYPQFAGGAGRGRGSGLFRVEAGAPPVEPGRSFDEQYPVGQRADPAGRLAQRPGGHAGEVSGAGEHILAGDVAGLGFVPGRCAAGKPALGG